MEEVLIEPGRGMANYWRDLWHYRELFYFVAWRDLAVRYKQTVIGVAWSVIRPVLTMIVFTVVFGRLAHLPSGGVPYPILVFAGLLPWTFFATGLAESASSMITNANMIAKVYFPRVVLPAGAIIVALVDFLISLGILFVLMAIYRYAPSWQIVTLPFFLLLALVTTLGSGLWLAALNVKYRDFRYIIPFLVQFGLYISPVGFSSHVVPANWQAVYSLNPMVGVINGFRWAILGPTTPIVWWTVLESALVGVLLFAAGMWYFYRTERSFADVI
jgi:lipopolysaccharide transport system permease protein